MVTLPYSDFPEPERRKVRGGSGRHQLLSFQIRPMVMTFWVAANLDKTLSCSHLLPFLGQVEKFCLVAAQGLSRVWEF